MSKDIDLSELPKGKKVIRCIICPTGCEITVENTSDELKITGYTCRKGEEYAREEFIAPKRIITATMRVEDGFLPIIPVRTDKPVPKELIFELIKELSCVTVKAPIKAEDVLIENIRNLGANVIASRDMPVKA